MTENKSKILTPNNVGLYLALMESRESHTRRLAKQALREHDAAQREQIRELQHAPEKP